MGCGNPGGAGLFRTGYSPRSRQVSHNHRLVDPLVGDLFFTNCASPLRPSTGIILKGHTPIAWPLGPSLLLPDTSVTMPNFWTPALVWADYRLALLFLVFIPLTLLGWATLQQSAAMQRLLIIYWRVSSLLAITVYLLIGALPLGFLSGWLARFLIPLGLWYWADLNEEIREQPDRPLKLAFTGWRWAVTVYCAIGWIAQTAILPCGFLSTDQVVETPMCQAWLQAPWLFRELVHSGAKPWFLGGMGLAGLGIYVLYLGYFVFFRMNKRKRSAIG